jgi:hypothetical protein
MHEVIKPESRALIIIGNNRYKFAAGKEGSYYEVQNNGVLKQITVSFKEYRYELDGHILKLRGDEAEGENEANSWLVSLEARPRFMDRYEDGLLRRKLEKSRSGNIKYESIPVLRKPPV